MLQWVSTQDIEILDQRDKDLKLVQLSKNIQSLQLEDAQVVNSTDKGKYNAMDEAEGEVDDMNSSTYEDSTQLQQNILLFTKNYFGTKYSDD